MLDRSESLGLGVDSPQPLLDLIDVVRCRLSMEIEEKSGLSSDQDLISSIIA
jgi:hypothetical protein